MILDKVIFPDLGPRSLKIFLQYVASTGWEVDLVKEFSTFGLTRPRSATPARFAHRLDITLSIVMMMVMMTTVIIIIIMIRHSLNRMMITADFAILLLPH